MKKYLTFLSAALCCVIIFSCDKADISNEEIQRQRIEDIIPKQYLDSLREMGLEINTGTTPPNVEGSYEIEPHILETSNFNDLYSPGYRFDDALVTLSNQSQSDYSIDFIGRDYLKDRDTSIATAISGTGNQFTVYGKVKASNSYNNAYAIAAIVFSGTIENNNIINGKTGLICIDDSHSDGTFISQGQGRIIFDSDKISKRVTNNEASASKKAASPNSFGGAHLLEKSSVN